MKKIMGFCLVFLFFGTVFAFSQSFGVYNLESANFNTQPKYVTVEERGELGSAVEVTFYETNGDRITYSFTPDYDAGKFGIRIPRNGSVDCRVNVTYITGNNFQTLLKDGIARIEATTHGFGLSAYTTIKAGIFRDDVERLVGNARLSFTVRR